MKKTSRQLHSTAGFELYEDEPENRMDDIEIYTDANARVPQLDESEDNPFVGRKKNEPLPQRRRSRKTADEIEHDARIEEAVNNDEGVTYVL